MSNKYIYIFFCNIKVIHGRRKFRELRQYMQTEDDDCGPSVNSTPDSQTSSAEGVFPITAKTAQPFRYIKRIL